MRREIHFLIIVLCSVMATHCTFLPPAEDYKKAMHLVDEGVLHLRQDRLEQAEAAFEVAVELADLPEAYDGLGCVSMLQGDLTQAEEYFDYVIKKDPSYVHVFSNLAQLYQLQGRYVEARTMYQRAISQAPQDYRVRNNYAVFRHERGVASERETLEQLHRAHVLAPHPLITDNINMLKE